MEFRDWKFLRLFHERKSKKFNRGSILKPGWEAHSSMPKVQDLIQNETIKLPMALYPLISLGLSSHLLSSLATRGISHIYVEQPYPKETLTMGD